MRLAYKLLKPKIVSNVRKGRKKWKQFQQGMLKYLLSMLAAQ